MTDQTLVSNERRDADRALGYRHGSDSDLPDTRDVADRGSYYRGYAAGSEARDRRMANGEGHVPRPDWMTDAQFEAVGKLYKRNPDGAKDRHEFYGRVRLFTIASDSYAQIDWCGMYMGIETDGYTHS